jgi:hypothetical protein
MPTFTHKTYCPTCHSRLVPIISPDGKHWWYAPHDPAPHVDAPTYHKHSWCMESLRRLRPDTELQVLVARGLALAEANLYDAASQTRSPS